MSNKVKYEVVEPNEVAELAVIKKSNIETNITLGETTRSIRQNAKGMDGVKAEIRLKKAIVNNIVEKHPEVLDVPKEIQIGCQMYVEAMRFIEMAEEKLKEFEQAQKELEEEVKEIELQTGLKALTAEEVAQKVKEMKESIKIVDEAGNPINL